MCEVLVKHKGMSQSDALTRATELLDLVRIPEAGHRIKMYPHEFSGGMRPASDDRHGAALSPEPPHRRRTDHRPGRHRAGADSGAAERSAQRDRYRHRRHHP